LTDYENIEIALRCYPDTVSNAPKNYRPGNNVITNDVLPDRVLVFDTETTIDRYQNLTFGSFQIYEHGILKHHGFFHGDNLPEKDMLVLRDYAVGHAIPLMSVREFVDNIFYPELWDLHSLCIGFNLPFDISRIALSWGCGREKNRGAFSFQLTDRKYLPRVIIEHKDSKMAFIKFGNGLSDDRGNNRHRKGKSKIFPGFFLDLKTLVFALTNRGLSLEQSCILFNSTIGKTHPGEHGKISPEYIEYNINDVRATYSLFVRLIDEYNKYHIDTIPTRIYSPASIGKAYIRQMGIESFRSKNPDFPKDILGHIMTTYYGGRSEVRTRKTPMRICLLDFLSMYPTMCILQKLWDFIISDRIDCIDDTDSIKEFVDSVSPKTFSDPQSWTKLNAIVQVELNDDIVPLRARYREKYAFNIGLNYGSCREPIYFALADVCASKLLTGKTPKILKAFRFVPRGIQPGLMPMSIIGERTIDPANEDFFKALMEYRNSIKDKLKTVDAKTDPTGYAYLNKLQDTVKIITNSTSYGIFVEINPEETKTDVTVYGNNSTVFTTTQNKSERWGIQFNPAIATFITSASRLVLAIAESILVKHGSMYAFCDTDSMAIPPEYVDEIQRYFQNLSPYPFDAPLFKLEPENFDDKKKFEPLWFLGISAKRYVLYNMRNGKPFIRKYSSHGLGHLLNPFKNQSIENEDWHKQIWTDILNEVYGIKDPDDIIEKYSSRYAISKMGVTSPHIIGRFKKLNDGKPYYEQIKPFNFMLVGTNKQTNPVTGKPIIPIVPFSKYPQTIIHGDFIDYNNGEILNGLQYWCPLDTMYSDYKNHKETKFNGDVGILTRKHLHITSIIHIGKESDKLEETETLGLNNDSYSVYSHDVNKTDIDEIRKIIMGLRPRIVKQYGISRLTLYRWKKAFGGNGPLTAFRQKNIMRLSRILRKVKS